MSIINARIAGMLLMGASSAALMGSAYADTIATEEIIVTARKRDESIMKTPVIMTAITGKQIENLKITNMDSLGSVTPGLTVGPAFVAVGATVFLRGLAMATPPSTSTSRL